jgi:hypothetical protein
LGDSECQIAAGLGQRADREIPRIVKTLRFADVRSGIWVALEQATMFVDVILCETRDAVTRDSHVDRLLVRAL